MDASPAPPKAPAVFRECLALWALAILGIAAAKWLLDPLLGGLVAPVPVLDGLFHAKTWAAVLFLYLPVLAMRRRGESPEDYGLRAPRPWRSVGYFLAVAGVVFPLYAFGFFGFVRAMPHLPPHWRALLGPYVGAGHFALRWPRRFPLQILDQLLVVALPEELFYRGYLQQRLKLRFGPGVPLFGIHVGAAFLWTQALFALGHLVEPYPWRLAVFFPALLFGWLRERTGDLSAGILLHASSNLLVLVLEASFFGIT
ncbi:MAG: myxosortase MrtX [Deltaproteobacteria bacterium]